MSAAARGYFGIGIENIKINMNIGTLWRSAHLLGAQFIFTIGDRYKHQQTDTGKSWKSIPLFQYGSTNEFINKIPMGCKLVGVELDKTSRPLKSFIHPEQCLYVLGAEDYGLSKEIMDKCYSLVQLPGNYSMNVAVAGSIVMYDRQNKLS